MSKRVQANCETEKLHSVTSLTKHCPRCDIHKLSRFAQREHNKLGHSRFWAKPYSCNKCGMRFTNKCSLHRHQLREENKMSFSCKTCNNFKTHRKDNLNVHILRCRGKKVSFIKEELKKGKEEMKLSSKYSYQTDDLIESEDFISDDENFTCGECDFVTMDITDLTMHMFIHSGIPDD
uniref:C2H2-type domain-containing protein n=1 Tax=Graphocephala atropunctata TaxID=36148 RepID=A0A1B6LY01_9HEMI